MEIHTLSHHIPTIRFLVRWMKMISVLLIDACISLQEITCKFLEQEGDIIIDVAQTPEEAPRKKTAFSYNVIIADYNRQETSVRGFLRHMRERGIMTPVVFFTIVQESRIETEMKKYDPVFFVPKLRNYESNFPELATIVRWAGLMDGERKPVRGTVSQESTVEMNGAFSGDSGGRFNPK